MSHLESAIADLYDHEQEAAPAGHRRRIAPDWGGDDLFTSTPRGRRFERPARGVPRARGERPSLLLIETAEHPVQRPRSTAAAQPAAVRPQRRTVTVTGHPAGLAARRRPAPTIDERLIGSRPERIAAYAVCLGLLLVLIAFLSAGA